MLILPTVQSEHIARILKQRYSDRFDFLSLGGNKDGKMEFPGGEVYVRVEDIEKIDGQDVTVLHCGAPRANTSTVGIFFTLYSLMRPMYSRGKDERGKKVFGELDVTARSKRVFFLYPAYCRQDWPDMTGGINAAEYLIWCITNHGVEKIYTLDAHFAADDWVTKYPLVNVSAKEILLEKAAKEGFQDLFLIGPDGSTMERMGVNGVKKDRLNSFETKSHFPEELADEVKGRDVGVVDDLLQSGSTMDNAAQHLRRFGVRRLVALLPHLRLDEGYRRIDSLYDAIFITNSIDNPRANVDVTDLVAQTLLKDISD